MAAKRYRGGGRVGLMNASWPFAGLEVDAHRMRFSGVLLGDHQLSPDDVVALEPWGLLPVFGWGVKIVHRRRDIPETLIFAHFLPPSHVIDGILSTGFRPAGRAQAPVTPRANDRLPFRASVLIAVVVLWNGLFFVDFVRGPLPGPFSLAALWLTFFLALAVHVSPVTRAAVLRRGRELGFAKNYVTLLQWVSLFLAVTLTILFVSGARFAAPGTGI
jgi:hypothetical protein